MQFLDKFFRKKPIEGYGRTAFITSLLFAVFSTAFMIWTEKEQKRRRQAGVKEYVRKLQHLDVTDLKKEIED